MRNILGMILICWAGMASADTVAPPLPALYTVSGVAADDVLNIRVDPDGAAQIRGSLPPDGPAVEVTGFSREGNWARINHGEGAGWVALRFLTRDSTPPAPADLTCFGTEPFWNINFGGDDSLRFSTPDSAQSHPITSPLPVSWIGAEGFTGLRFTWTRDATPVTALILPGQCSDGMSDRLYALHYVETTGGLTGCCSLN